MVRVVGVALGATNVRAAVADSEGALLSDHRRATPRGPAGPAGTGNGARGR